MRRNNSLSLFLLEHSLNHFVVVGLFGSLSVEWSITQKCLTITGYVNLFVAVTLLQIDVTYLRWLEVEREHLLCYGWLYHHSIEILGIGHGISHHWFLIDRHLMNLKSWLLIQWFASVPKVGSFIFSQTILYFSLLFGLWISCGRWHFLHLRGLYQGEIFIEGTFALHLEEMVLTNDTIQVNLWECHSTCLGVDESTGFSQRW